MSKAPAVDYALEIIEFFAGRYCGTGIADISNALGINKNAVSRVLEALLEKNWIYMCDAVQKKYALTMRPFSLMSSRVNENSILKMAYPYMEQLNRELGDSVYLGIKNGKNVLYLAHLDSTREVRVAGRVGGEYPLNCSAPGKLLLSHSDESECTAYFEAPAEKRTRNTIVDYQSFRSEADSIRRMGYSVDDEEFADGIVCIAVPVYDNDGNIAAALGISSLTIYDSVGTLTENKLPALLSAAKIISANLGCVR